MVRAGLMNYRGVKLLTCRGNANFLRVSVQFPFIRIGSELLSSLVKEDMTFPEIEFKSKDGVKRTK